MTGISKREVPIVGPFFEKVSGAWVARFQPFVVFMPRAGGTFSAAVSGVAPTDDAHLTRMDYVDAADNLRALLTGATFTGPVHAVTPTAGNNSTQLATTEFVADGFHGASFNNFNRHLVLSRLGGGAVASLPLTFLNAFQGVDPIAGV